MSIYNWILILGRVASATPLGPLIRSPCLLAILCVFRVCSFLPCSCLTLLAELLDLSSFNSSLFGALAACFVFATGLELIRFIAYLAIVTDECLCYLSIT